MLWEKSLWTSLPPYRLLAVYPAQSIYLWDQVAETYDDGIAEVELIESYILNPKPCATLKLKIILKNVTTIMQDTKYLLWWSCKMAAFS